MTQPTVARLLGLGAVRCAGRAAAAREEIDLAVVGQRLMLVFDFLRADEKKDRFLHSTIASFQRRMFSFDLSLNDGFRASRFPDTRTARLLSLVWTEQGP